jgi:hypothetical protein
VGFLRLYLLLFVVVAVLAYFVDLPPDFVHIAIVHSCLVLHKVQLRVLKLGKVIFFFLFFILFIRIFKVTVRLNFDGILLLPSLI